MVGYSLAIWGSRKIEERLVLREDGYGAPCIRPPSVAQNAGLPVDPRSAQAGRDVRTMPNVLSPHELR